MKFTQARLVHNVGICCDFILIPIYLLNEQFGMFNWRIFVYSMCMFRAYMFAVIFGISFSTCKFILVRFFIYLWIQNLKKSKTLLKHIKCFKSFLNKSSVCSACKYFPAILSIALKCLHLATLKKQWTILSYITTLWRVERKTVEQTSGVESRR